MEQFFAENYTGPAFELLGPAHIGALIALVLFNLLLLRYRDSSDGVKGALRWLLALV